MTTKKGVDEAWESIGAALDAHELKAAVKRNVARWPCRKPKPDPATQWLLDHAMPFLGLHTQRLGLDLLHRQQQRELPGFERKPVDRFSELAETILAPFRQIIRGVRPAEGSDEKLAERMQGESWRDHWRLSHILTTAIGCQAMIASATREQSLGVIWFPPRHQETIVGSDRPVSNTPIRAWVKTTLLSATPLVDWEHPGATTVVWLPAEMHPHVALSTEEKRFEAWVHRVRYVLVTKIIEAFAVDPAPAWIYLAVCPHCGRAFRKRRTNQQFDRPSCNVHFARGSDSM